MNHIHVVIDRSGSMGAIKSDAIGGFNQFLEDTRGKKQRWSIWLFDSEGIDLIADAVKAKKVEPLTEATFVPRAFTPLYDAAGKALAHAKAKTGDKNVFVVLTDGHENASREFTAAQVKADLDALKDDWQIVFIGVGKDAWDESAAFSQGVVMASAPTGAATRASYGQTTKAVGSYFTNDAPMSTSLSVDESGNVKKRTTTA